MIKVGKPEIGQYADKYWASWDSACIRKVIAFAANMVAI